MELSYMDDWFGLVDRINDVAYAMDDFVNAIRVDFSLPSFYFQDC
jgi:hypothetical protein